METQLFRKPVDNFTSLPHTRRQNSVRRLLGKNLLFARWMLQPYSSCRAVPPKIRLFAPVYVLIYSMTSRWLEKWTRQKRRLPFFCLFLLLWFCHVSYSQGLAGLAMTCWTPAVRQHASSYIHIGFQLAFNSLHMKPQCVRHLSLRGDDATVTWTCRSS
jgi:hypothetical protein